MKKIKILYCIPNFDTCATGYAMMKLVNSLDREYFEPEIMCLHNKGKNFELVENSGFKYYIYPYLTPLKPRLKLLFGVLRVAFKFKRINPDIIYSYHYSSDFSEALSARLVGIKFIYIKKNMGWFGPSFNQWRFKTFLSNAVVYQNSDMLKLFFPKTDKAVFISLGVDTKEYFKRPKHIGLLYDLKIDIEKKIILCVANIIPKKGIEYLIRGFYLSKLFPETILLIVGDNSSSLGSDLKKLTNDLNISEWIYFTGKRYDIPLFYSLADLFILPSTGNEGAPVAIQEAMSSEVIVLTTDTPGNRDQLRLLPDQIIPPKDENAIANSMIKYINIDNNRKSEILTKQLEIINQSYTLTIEVSKHEDLYRKLVFNE